MTETVARWRDFLPEYFVLPHPSWRTIGWLRGNPWYENEALLDLRSRIGKVLDPAHSIGGTSAVRTFRRSDVCHRSEDG
jgi:hypothetical protein